MKIRYEFLCGEVTEVEVDAALGEVIVAFEHIEKLNNRRETRRHESYSNDNDKQDRLVDFDIDLEAEVIQKTEAEVLRRTVSPLKPKEQYIINRLYLDDITVTQAELARELSISEDS